MKTTFAASVLLLAACASLRQPTSKVVAETEPGSAVAHVVVQLDTIPIPGVQITFENSATSCTEFTSVTGELTAPIGAGTWKMSAALPGFATARKTITVAPNQDIQIHVQLAEERLEDITIYEPPPTIPEPGVFSLNQREIDLLPIR